MDAYAAEFPPPQPTFFHQPQYSSHPDDRIQDYGNPQEEEWGHNSYIKTGLHVVNVTLISGQRHGNSEGDESMI